MGRIRGRRREGPSPETNRSLLGRIAIARRRRLVFQIRAMTRAVPRTPTSPRLRDMLSAVIRPVETVAVEVSGGSLAEVYQHLTAQTPSGFDLAKAPVNMAAGSSDLTAVGTFTRVDGTKTIEAADMGTLKALVPDGWRMLCVWRS